MRIRNKLLALITMVLITTTALSMVLISPVKAAPAIGTTPQLNPFESNPTAGTIDPSIITTQGALGNTYDGLIGSSLTWRIGSSVAGYVQVDTFDSAPATPFTIGWVDLKMTYKSSPTTDDRYRIEYQVGGSSWTILEYMRLINFLTEERHAENIAVDGVFNAGEAIYRDRNKDGLVDTDVVLAATGTSTNPTGEPTVGTTLRISASTDKFIDRNTNGVWDAGEPAIRDNDGNNKYGGPDKYADRLTPLNKWNTGEQAIRDVDNNGVYSTGDVILAGSTSGLTLNVTPLKTPPNATCMGYDLNGNGVWDQTGTSPYTERAILDKDSSGTYTTGDVVIVGTATGLVIGTPLIAPGTDQLLAGTPVGTGASMDSGKVLVAPGAQDKYADANGNLLWDIKTQLTIGPPPTYSEEPAIRDTNDDNAYCNDPLKLGPAQATGTAVIQFTNEKHTETQGWDNLFGGPTNAEAVYLDLDNSFSLTAGDVYIDGGGAPTVGWTYGAVAKFNYDGATWTRAWSNVSDPNTSDGHWEWADIGNLKVRVETQQIGTGEDSSNNVFDLFEVWATIYGSSFPPPGPGISIQPPEVSGLAANSNFFIDVYATDMARMHGFGFKINYDTNVLTATEYWTYNPFTSSSPSIIDDVSGYVAVAYSSFMGDGVGLIGSNPVLRIYFKVDSNAYSAMSFDQSLGKFTVTNVLGQVVLPNYVYNGVYRGPLALSAYDVDTGYPTMIDLTTPESTYWNELYPDPIPTFHLTSWEDNDGGYLSASDQIDMLDDVGSTRWFHVDLVTITIHFTFKDTGEVFKAEPVTPMTEMPSGDPTGSQWHQISGMPIPGTDPPRSFCRVFTIQSWDDNTGNIPGVFDPSDQFDFSYNDDPLNVYYAHLDYVSTDMYVTEKPVVPELPVFIIMPLALLIAVVFLALRRKDKTLTQLHIPKGGVVQ